MYNTQKSTMFGFLILLAFSYLQLISVQGGQVFANYLLATPSTGLDVDSFKKDMQKAKSYGIDAFAINTAIWRSASWVVPRADLMYEAARQLNSGFMLFFCMDMTKGLNETEIREMVTRYKNHPNQMIVNDGHFLTTIGGQNVKFGRATAAKGWQEAFIDPLQKQGITLTFFPQFVPSTNTTGPNYIGTPTQDSLFNTLQEFLFISGLASAPSLPYFYGDVQHISSDDIENYQASLMNGFKYYMAPISPWYFKHINGSATSLNNFLYGNYSGPELWIQRWDDILLNKPYLVHIFSWNNFDDRSYVGPTDGPYRVKENNDGPFPHIAFLDLAKYFIDAYKDSVEPKVTDEKLYIFYRSHSNKAKAANDPLPPPTHYQTQDDFVYVTVLLKSSATIKITSGKTSKQFPVKAGLSTVSMPFEQGKPSAQLIRGGKAIASITGKLPISDDIQVYNFNIYSDLVIAK